MMYPNFNLIKTDPVQAETLEREACAERTYA